MASFLNIIGKIFGNKYDKDVKEITPIIEKINFEFSKLSASTNDELREKTMDQLTETLETLKKEGFNLRFQQATGQVENTAQMRRARRDVARVKTIINEKSAIAVEEQGK